MRAVHPSPRALTQDDIDAAVLHTLETQTLPAKAAKAYEAVRESVVRVRGLGASRRRKGTSSRASAPASSSWTTASSSPTCTSSPAPSA